MKMTQPLSSKVHWCAITTTRWLIGSLSVVLIAASPRSAFAAGDPVQGALAFRNCMACHSIEEGQNMTGPSLAGLLGRKAAGLPTFRRYSDALKRSGIVWNAETLNAWIYNPAALVPGNDMRFPGIPDALTRGNLVAYLESVSEGKGRSAAFQAGMTMGGGLPDLKDARPEAQARTIGYCGDTYTITTGAGKKLTFWEFNLRFKTDSSGHGPRKGEPVLVGQGMQGDRAQLVFSSPSEIGTLIKKECP